MGKIILFLSFSFLSIRGWAGCPVTSLTSTLKKIDLSGQVQITTSNSNSVYNSQKYAAGSLYYDQVVKNLPSGVTPISNLFLLPDYGVIFAEEDIICIPKLYFVGPNVGNQTYPVKSATKSSAVLFDEFSQNLFTFTRVSKSIAN